MTARVHSAQELTALLRSAPSIPANKDRSETRAYATGFTGLVAWVLIQAGILALNMDTSPLRIVCTVAGFPLLIGWTFLLMAALLLPHLFALVFLPSTLGRTLPRKIATGTMCAAAVLWALLGTTARPLDLGLLHWTYWGTAALFLMAAAIFGYSLNTQQAQEQKDAQESPNC